MEKLLRPRQQSVIPHLAWSLTTKRAVQRQAQKQNLHNTSLSRPSVHALKNQYVQKHSRRAATFVPRKPPASSRTTQPSRNQPEHKDPAPEPRKITGMIWASSLFGFSLALYLSSLYMSYTGAIKKTARIDLPQNADVSDRWKDLTRDYDDEVNNSEFLMLMKSKRKKLVNEAYGNVLEVSVGTGRNMDLYDLRPYDPDENARTGRSRRRLIRSLTFNDQSEYMVGQAEKKFAAMEAKRSRIEQFRGPVNFVVGDASIKGVIKRPEGGYDTIVQTMGVCSMVDPVAFLKRLGELCRQPGENSKWPTEDDNGRGGKILLLEHGQGHYNWINRFLDNGAKMHAIHYGCWWNKDMSRIIEESGLVVERMRRYHLGTTWEIVLRPAKRDEKP